VEFSGKESGCRGESLAEPLSVELFFNCLSKKGAPPAMSYQPIDRVNEFLGKDDMRAHCFSGHEHLLLTTISFTP